jgi:prepilin-type processing-associated H-X9-DG protein
MVSPVIQTPAVFGFSRPVILLPEQWENTMSDEEISSVLAHELAHVKRLDMVVTWLATLLGCLYWFHPGVWMAHLQLRREREMACDDMALRSTKSEGKQYASTILHVAESFTGGVPVAAGFLGLVELSDNLLHRIRSAADITRARRLGWRAVLGLVLVTAACVPMGRWARPPATDETAIDREIREQEHIQLIKWCANNLKQMGRVFKMYAHDRNGRWPHIDDQRGNLMVEADEIFPEYLADLNILRCQGALGREAEPLRAADDVTDEGYFYLGWVVTNEEEGLTFLDAYESEALAGAYEDIPVPMGKGTGGQNVIYRIHEGVERLFITDISDPSGPARVQSGIPVMWERPGHHVPDGGNVLYMDGHVSFVEYPGEFPMTPKFMERLVKTSAKKDSR